MVVLIKMENKIYPEITINDFKFDHINWWLTPIFTYKDKYKVCVPDALLTYIELKEKLSLVIRKLNKGIIRFYTLIDDEPITSFAIANIPEENINMTDIINNYGESEC